MYVRSLKLVWRVETYNTHLSSVFRGFNECFQQELVFAAGQNVLFKLNFFERKPFH